MSIQCPARSPATDVAVTSAELRSTSTRSMVPMPIECTAAELWASNPSIRPSCVGASARNVTSHTEPAVEPEVSSAGDVSTSGGEQVVAALTAVRDLKGPGDGSRVGHLDRLDLWLGLLRTVLNGVGTRRAATRV
eukprot:scaffold1102_cov256-Pinguiococcus_pyrenoidosus.AAC.27